MLRWPWITALLGIALALSPLGQDVIQGVRSGESITRDLSSLLLMFGLGILAALLGLEILVRYLIHRRWRNAARTE
jgi:hypothetical protein